MIAHLEVDKKTWKMILKHSFKNVLLVDNTIFLMCIPNLDFFFFFQGRQVRIVGIYLAVTLVDTKKCFVFEHLQKVEHISSLFLSL